jgi:hypothetical protein
MSTSLAPVKGALVVLNPWVEAIGVNEVTGKNAGASGRGGRNLRNEIRKTESEEA